MGRDQKNERRSGQFTTMVRQTMETCAWRSLNSAAQALYPWLKLEWKGPKRNNNGKISLSVRQAAERLGVSRNTAMRAFHDLQAKGFLVVTVGARLGVLGDGKSHEFEITEIELPNVEKRGGRSLFKTWSKGNDFPILRAHANNPSGHNRKQNPVSNLEDNVIKMMTSPENAS